jgi:hypothetical protein
MRPVLKRNTGNQNRPLRGYTQMEFPTDHTSTTLDRDGVTTIETKRWLMGTLHDERDGDSEAVPGASNKRVASD